MSANKAATQRPNVAKKPDVPSRRDGGTKTEAVAKFDWLEPDAAARSILALLYLTVGMVVVLVVGIVVTTATMRSVVPRRIVAVATDGKGVVVPVESLDKPYASEEQVLEFASQCVRKAFSHDYLRFGETLLVAQECFTVDAGDRFASAIQPFFKEMVNKQANLTVGPIVDQRCPLKPIASAPRPVMTDRGVVSPGIYMWEMAVIACLSFEGRDQRILPVAYRIDITVQRASLDEASQGIEVAKFLIKPMT